jgi:hypothetical protein
MMPEMEMVKDAALKYDKPTLGRMAQMGQISPTVAVMAGMMRDRIVQSEMKPPAPPTVAEEVLQPMGQRMGLGAMAPGMGQGMGQPPQPPLQPPAPQGIDQIPVPEQMFQPQGMAGGGVVAFDNGGSAMFTGSPLGQNVRGLAQVSPRTSNILAPGAVFFQYMTDDEKRIYEATGVVPESTKQRYQQQASKQAIQPSFTQALAGPPIDDSAEMARLARQTQGTGVPMTPPPPPPPPPPSGERPAAKPGPETAPVSKPTSEGIFSFLKDKDRFAELKSLFGSEPAAAQKTLMAEMKENGFDPLVYSKAAGRLAEQKAELKKDRTEAANLRLIEAGLGILGGESPYAFVNIGKGASPAMQGFAKDIQEIKKNRRELDKLETELQLAQNQLATNVTSANRKEVADLEARKERYNQTLGTNFMNLAKHIEDNRTKLFQIDTQARVQRETAAAQRETAARPTGTEYEIRALSGEFGTNIQKAAEKKLTSRQEITQDQLLNRWNSMSFLEKNKLLEKGTTFEQWANEQRRLASARGITLNTEQQNLLDKYR